MASSRQNNHIGRAKLADSARVIQSCRNGVRNGEFQKSWSQICKKKRKSAEDSALFDNVASEKLKFPLYIFPDTMEKVNMLYETDNCRSKTEFMEKAIRFYCGYLLNKESTATEFIAPQLAVITEGIVKGSEQKLSRALFKLAVEVGALTHMLAAINEIDDETLKKLRIMCVDEVKRINGIINFEKAVRYQRSGD